MSDLHKKDPIGNAPPSAVELFKQMGTLCNGFPVQDIVNAAANIIISAYRQTYSSRQAAEKGWDDTMGRSKAVLMECYDSTGRVKGVYPYNQHIIVPHVDLRKKE